MVPTSIRPANGRNKKRAIAENYRPPNITNPILKLDERILTEMKSHFKRIVKRNFRPLTERQQEQNAEDNAHLGPLIGRTVSQAEKWTQGFQEANRRYRQLDELQRDWAIAAGRLPEMVGRGDERVEPQGLRTNSACSHQWINPKDPPIERLPYSPVIGSQRYEMKYGVTYRCQRCGDVIEMDLV